MINFVPGVDGVQNIDKMEAENRLPQCQEPYHGGLLPPQYKNGRKEL